jgi:hypothetical protein
LSRIDVNYSDRPNKSLVRARMLHIVEETFRPRHEHFENLSFITLSGFRFIDSIEFYQRFNIRNIYSIECNAGRYKRAKFNCPYCFINLTKGRIQDFIDDKYSLVSAMKKVIFLDYESRLIDEIISDVNALFASGFFDTDCLLFIAFNRTFLIDKLTPRIKELLPDHIKTHEAFESWLSDGFSNLVLDKLVRKYGERKQLKEILKAFYRDTSPMVIFGYLIRDKGDSNTFESTVLEEFNLPELTFLEANHIHNNLEGNPNAIADEIGLSPKDVETYIQYS